MAPIALLVLFAWLSGSLLPPAIGAEEGDPVGIPLDELLVKSPDDPTVLKMWCERSLHEQNAVGLQMCVNRWRRVEPEGWEPDVYAWILHVSMGNQEAAIRDIALAQRHGIVAAVAERHRVMVERSEIPTGGGPLGVTISAGFALMSEGSDIASVIHCADQRLYEAKRGGRNRVVG